MERKNNREEKLGEGEGEEGKEKGRYRGGRGRRSEGDVKRT